MTNQLNNHCEYIHGHKSMYTKIHRVAHQTDNNREFGGNLGWKVGWPKRILVFSVMFRFCLLLSRFSRVLLCDPIDGSPPGSSVPGILQARTLAWVAISFSRGTSQPRDQTRLYLHCPQTFYPLSHQGSPKVVSSSASSKKERFTSLFLKLHSF